MTAAARVWADLDEPWQEAFRQAWEALRKPVRDGSRRDELGAFATLISRFGPGLSARYEKTSRVIGEGPSVDLARHLQDTGEADRLLALEVNEALEYLWPRLGELAA